MKIAMIGYGRMGHEIESIAVSRGHTVVTIDSQGEADFKEIDEKSMEGVDVAIDFTVPDAAIGNAKKLNDLGVNTIMGTTGWYDSMDEMKSSVSNIGFLWSGNFSIGVNLFFRMLESAAKIINKVPEYDVSAVEYHHKGKADSPSGTAKMMGDILINNIERKEKLVTEMLDRKIDAKELHFASVRGGSVPGTHSILFDSEADSIELTHTARNRKGFALGAVMAAEWVKDKKGFFGIDDFMDELIK
jgi:4-hydroxy-tetrahydrodipicolinate reductase